jgi:hypothetical protein
MTWLESFPQDVQDNVAYLQSGFVNYFFLKVRLSGVVCDASA